jgi:hypothetical protein
MTAQIGTNTHIFFIACYSQLIFIKMDTLNFIFNLNRVQVDEHLKNVGYVKIGHKKYNSVGYCIMITRKQYFEIESSQNPNITQSNNIADIKQYCV